MVASVESRMSLVDIDQLNIVAATSAINTEIIALEGEGFVVREHRIIALGPKHNPKQYVLLLGVLPSHLDHGDSAAHNVHLKSAQTMRVFPTPVSEKDGTALVAFNPGANPEAGYAVVDSKAEGVRWNNHATPDPIVYSMMLPNDLDETKDVVIHYMASKVGATLGDAVTWLTEAFFQTVGALHDADANAGGTSSAMTGDAATKTVQEDTLTVASADVPAAPCKLTLTVQPTDGTLDTDDVVLHNVWIEYTPKMLTS